MKSCTGLGAARVLVAGYYGAGNIGDEAVLAGLLEGLRFQGITKITALSFNPAETARIHGVDAVLNGRRFEGLPALRKLASKSDLFILGGGGLLWDQNPHVAPYWLSKVACAMSARCPVVYYALGVDRLATRTAKLMAQVVSNRAKAITVRDLDSADALRAAGVSRPAITVTADPALLMPSLNYRDVGVDSADGKLNTTAS
jgi:polysaccharide pyruvyl transferase WcaK-like protein